MSTIRKEAGLGVAAGDDPQACAPTVPWGALSAEVEGRFGVLPNFFRTADVAPEVALQLWAFAKPGYLDNPLPSLFKERLFVHLSRFCSVRYCIVRHAGFLLGRGHPAGDASAPPQTIEQVAALLRRKSRLEGTALDAALERLQALAEPCLPDPEDSYEEDVFAAATEVFLDPLRAEASRQALRKALGLRNLELLTAYLAFVHAAHYWTLTHPDLALEEDAEALLRDHAELAQLLMEDPEAAHRDRSAGLLAELEELRAAQSERERIDRGAEQALALSEERLRLASDAAGFGVYDFDVTSGRSVWSPQLRRIVGREGANGEISFQDAMALIHPDDRAGTRARMEEAMRRPGHYEMEFRIVRPDGAVRWVLDRGETFAPDGGGSRFARRGAGTLIDITERKLTEERLRESEGRFREMADNLPLIVWMHDAEGLQQFVNQTFCSYFGLDRADMHTDRWQVLVHPDDVPGYVDEFLACIRDRRPFHAECRVRRADGQWRWIESWGRPRLTPTGRFLGHIGTSADITERKKAEDRLRESELRFRGIYEHAGTGIAIADLEGRFRACNPAYAAMLGYSEDELRRMVSSELVHPDDRAENMAATRRLIAGEVPSFEILNRYLGKDGRTIWVHKRISMLPDGAGTPTHLIILVTDMTERKRADEHRQLLVNELNHRVKNTLAVVQAIAQQTFKGSDGAGELFTSFQNRLAALAAAHNLLSRVNWERASLEELARETTAASFARAERIRLGGPQVVLAPKKAVTLAMALHELCTNAMKYGALSVEAGRIDLTWDASDGRRPALRLVWRESGGPPVAAPQRKGFGSRIIEQALAHEFDGTVAMDFRREGLVVTLDGWLPQAAAGETL